MNKKAQKRLIIALLAVFVGVFAFSLTYAIASSITAKTIIKLVNESRNKEGLSVLQENPQLSVAALEKAQDMIQNDYFAHNSPAGKTPWYWIEKNGYSYKYAGENLAMNFTNAEDEQKAWMKSESHRKNILNSNYQEIGVGVAEGEINGKTTTVAVQMFGSRPDFIPAAGKNSENKSVVLGDENKGLLPVEAQKELKEDILVNDFIPEKIIMKDATPGAISISWNLLKDKFSPENRPGWAVPLALNTLWMILVGNLLFLAYSFLNKVKTAAKKDSESSGEQKIPVEDLGEDVSGAIKIHVLHAAK